MRRALLTAVALLVMALVAPEARAQLNMQTALSIAQGNSPGLTLLYSRAEPSNVWGFYFLNKDGKLQESEVNAQGKVDTKVVDVISPISPDPKKPVPTPPNNGKIDPNVVTALKSRILTKLPNFQYIEIALQQYSGNATSYTTIVVQGQLQIQVGGQSDDGASWTVTMDMNTGQIVR